MADIDGPNNNEKVKIAPSHPYATTLFCDDIRIENTGKAIHIGVYGNDMFVSELPVKLPTFTAVIEIVVPAEVEIEQLSLKAIFAGQEMFAVPPEEILNILENASAESEEMRRWVAETDPDDIPSQSLRIFRFAFNGRDFVIDKEGVFRFRLELNGERVRSRGLRILKRRDA